ncbi:MAG: RimK family alpha-L-glutamate ligase [Planctomycetes bacterium]|nr:RimK family alpha-L-glutamate ligase [Planctomycetota bacterium]
MKIISLSRKSDLHSTRRLRAAAEARGHQWSVEDPHDFQIEFSCSGTLLYCRGEPFTGGSVALPRFGPTVGEHGLAVVRAMEQAGIPAVNSAAAIETARDKLRSFQRLIAAEIPLPRTWLVRTSGEFRKLTSGWPSGRYVVKLPLGAQGIGVMLAESRAAVESILDTMWGLQNTVLVQEFLEASAGRDLRVLVLGGQALGAIRRTAPPGEFRSNLHRGGCAQPAKLSGFESSLAVQVATVLGLDFAGVDLAESEKGIMVLEANAAPGFQGIESASGLDVAGHLIKFLEEKVCQRGIMQDERRG